MCCIVECLDIIVSLDTQRFRKKIPCLFACFVYGTTAFFVLTQMLYVLPELFDTDGIMYRHIWIVAAFVSYNILGNMSACHRLDTTVRILSWKRRFPSKGEESLWRYCDICQWMMPPRSWHCKLCECCILKRDHHCYFMDNCVGYNNQRYFLFFNFYMCVGLILTLGTTIIVMLKRYDFYYVITWLCPVAAIYLDDVAIGPSPPTWLGLTVMFNAHILLCPLVTLILEVLCIYRNAVVFDLFNDTYDLGLRDNFRSVVGERGLWTFLSPTVKSPFLHDGSRWPEKPLKSVAIESPLPQNDIC